MPAQEPATEAEPKKHFSKNIIGTTKEELEATVNSATPEVTDNSLLTTAPNDPRFPNTNQTRACWQYYVDAHKCALAKAEVGGKEHPGCKKLARLARIMCPGSWIEKWDTALEEGRNPSSLEFERGV